MTDFDDFAGGKLPQDKLSKIARGEPLSATEEFVRGQRLSTAEKTIRDYLDSPSMKLARDYLDSPAARLAREHAELPAAQVASQFGALTEQGAAAAKMAEIQKALEPPPGYAEQLAVIRSLDVEHDAVAKIGAIFPTGIDPKIIEAIRGVQPFTIDLGLASAVSRAQQQFEEAVRPLGGVAEAFTKFDQQHRDAQKAMLATLAGPFGDIARTGQWASVLSAVETPSVPPPACRCCPAPSSPRHSCAARRW